MKKTINLWCRRSYRQSVQTRTIRAQSMIDDHVEELRHRKAELMADYALENAEMRDVIAAQNIEMSHVYPVFGKTQNRKKRKQS